MTRHRTDVLSGEGEIYAGGRLLRRTTYRLRIVDGAAPGKSRIAGEIAVATEGEAIILTRAERLTLLLDDGRHLSFSLVNPAGAIEVHGGLEGIEASPK